MIVIFELVLSIVVVSVNSVMLVSVRCCCVVLIYVFVSVMLISDVMLNMNSIMLICVFICMFVRNGVMYVYSRLCVSMYVNIIVSIGCMLGSVIMLSIGLCVLVVCFG